jgi:SagB-type dehydrogenase family enzyme
MAIIELFPTTHLDRDVDPGAGLERARQLEESIRLASRHTPHQTPADVDAEPPWSWTARHEKAFPRLPHVQLPGAPSASVEAAALTALLDRRVSTRHFADQPVNAEVLAWLLDTAGRATLGSGPGRRPYPSAGARFPVEWYVAACNVDGLNQGVYHASGAGPLVRLTSGDPWPTLSAAFADQPLVGRPGLVVMLTAVLWRSWVKYGARGSRFAYLEAGAAAQCLDLAAVAAGLGVVWLGGFVDDTISALIDVNWEMELETPVLCVAVGHRQQS